MYPSSALAALPASATLLESVGKRGLRVFAQLGFGGTTPAPTALFVALALPFLGALVVPLAYRLVGERVSSLAAAISLASFLLVASQYGTHGVVSVPWIPALDASLTLYLDGLSLLIALLASGVGVLIFVYSGAYMHDEPSQPKYYATLLAFLGAMLGVALAADLIALFVFWELTSVASFLLIGHYGDPDGQYAARKSMLITVAGGLFMLVGFLLLSWVAGQALGDATFALIGTDGSMLANADAMADALRENGLFLPVLALIAIGAAAKSAQVPLHIWLPNAMEAPTPVSAFLHSATMVKAGVYLIGRMRPLLVSAEWTALFVTLGLVTMTVTAILAVAASDIKELLAYSTASHLGLIVAGFGFAAELGAETGAFHILNHALFKATLFLVAGIVAHEVGTRKIDALSGLRHDLPITAVVTAIAALGMAGVPPFNGFYSKELLFEAAYAFADGVGGLTWVVPAIAVVGSVFTFLYSIKFLSLFFGEKPDALGTIHSPPMAMLAPPALLAGLAAVIGINPQLGVDLLAGGAFESTLAAAPEHAMEVHFPTSLKPAVVMSLLTIGFGVITYPFYDRLRDGIRSVLATRALCANWYYDGALAGAERLGALSIPQIQTGYLRTYVGVALAATSVLALAGYLAAGVSLPTFSGVGVTLPIVIVLVVAVVGAVGVGIAPSHVAGVLTLSIVGFMVAVFYVLASAPDLALTQLVVETLVLVLFLVVLDKLPAFYGDAPLHRTLRDGALALVVGVTVTLTVLVSTAGTPEDVIATYFLEQAPLPDGGGGSNVVNVILVDFRAFDTLGEISVVAMAALSVLTLIVMRGEGELP